MDNIYELLGQRLREQRLALGLTQKALAEKADVSVAFLSFLESGRRKGSLQTYADLAKALGLGLDQLLKPAPKGRRQEEPPLGAFAGLTVAESAAVEQLVKTLRRKR
jgi:transcriptional regulator with XRE-family HTH domain